MAAGFLAVVLFARGREPDFAGAGPFARFSASSWDARAAVICSIASARGTVTLVSPSVMYAPKRPSLMTIRFSVSGSAPRSASGGLAAWRPRCFGWA